MIGLCSRYKVDPDRSKASDAVNVQAQAVGALAAGAFAALDTSASTIFTAGGVKWLKATGAGTTAGPYTAKTKHDAFDQEVTTYTRSGSITLRYANGEGLMLIWNAHVNDTNGSLIIGRVSGVDDTQPVAPGGFPFTDVIYQTNTLISTFGVVKANYATDTLTFGVSGFDLYVKYNGVTLDIPALKGSAWRVMQPGKIMLSARAVISDPEGTAGFRDIAISYPAKPVGRYSNFTSKAIDLRDFGLKSVETTGSINATSNQLTVASAAGFAVGDQVIVAVGSETALSSIYSNTAAAGRRGTIGVGGSWPAAANHYANQTARLAASPADGSYAELDTGRVYERSGGAWQGYDAAFYYFNMIVPQALVAKITAIAGNVLTLDKNAVAAASGAQVMLDVKPAFKPLTDSATSPIKGVELAMPPGQYWHSGSITSVNSPRDDWKLTGYDRLLTILQQPKGASWTGIYISGADRIKISSFHMRSNHDLHGYGVTGRGDLGTLVTINGINVDFSEDSIAENMKFSECGRALATQYTRRSGGRKCLDERLIAPDQCYLQWQFDLTDSEDPILEDCTINSNWLLKSLEFFSTTGGSILRCGGRNALTAMNAASAWVIEDHDVVIEANSHADSVPSPIGIDGFPINVNSNIGFVGAVSRPPGSGGIIRRPKIDIQGYLNASNFAPRPINITSNADVLVEGTYNPLVADDGQRKGLIRAPRIIASGLGSGNGGATIGSDSQRTVVRGMRLQTVPDTPNGGATPSAAGSLINCYHGPTATISGIAALGSNGLGFCTLSTLSYWGGGGVIRVDSELMEFVVTNAGTRTIEIKSRGYGGTTAAAHSNGATATSIDYSTVEDNVVDVVSVTSTSTAQRNVTNAAYAAL